MMQGHHLIRIQCLNQFLCHTQGKKYGRALTHYCIQKFSLMRCRLNCIIQTWQIIARGPFPPPGVRLQGVCGASLRPCTPHQLQAAPETQDVGPPDWDDVPATAPSRAINVNPPPNNPPGVVFFRPKCWPEGGALLGGEIEIAPNPPLFGHLFYFRMKFSIFGSQIIQKPRFF